MQGNMPIVRDLTHSQINPRHQQENFNKQKDLSHQQRNLDCIEMNSITNEAQIEDVSDPLSMTS